MAARLKVCAVLPTAVVQVLRHISLLTLNCTSDTRTVDTVGGDIAVEAIDPLPVNLSCLLVASAQGECRC